jgi:hypothetical protein
MIAAIIVLSSSWPHDHGKTEDGRVVYIDAHICTHTLILVASCGQLQLTMLGGSLTR